MYRIALWVWGAMLMIPGCVAGASASDATATTYIDAAIANDSTRLYELSYAALIKAQNIRQTKPKVLWDQLLQAGKEEFIARRARSSFVRSEFERMAALGPRVEILETRELAMSASGRTELLVFIRFSYPTPARSPLRSSGAGGPYRTGLPVKIAIFELRFDKGTLGFLREAPVREGTELWQSSPPRMISASYRGIGDLDVYFFGGQPPYEVQYSCGTSTSRRTLSRPASSFSFKMGSASGNCSVTLHDAEGNSDTAWLTIKAREAPRGSLGMATATLQVDWFGRAPWVESGFTDVLFDGLVASTSELRDSP